MSELTRRGFIKLAGAATAVALILCVTSVLGEAKADTDKPIVLKTIGKPALLRDGYAKGERRNFSRRPRIRAILHPAPLSDIPNNFVARHRAIGSEL